jgi:hypothetical protein
MPFSEQEKRNLVNNGKFKEQQVAFLDETGVSYDILKECQSVLQELMQLRGDNVSLESINLTVYESIKTYFENLTLVGSLIDINSLVEVQFIASTRQQIEAYQNANNNYASSVDSENHIEGGKTRKKMRSKRRTKTRKSRKNRKKSRKFRR